MPKVAYDGIGANESKIHTIDEFLYIMNRDCTHKKWSDDILYRLVGREYHYQLQFKDWVLPDDFMFFTLNDWLEYSGARLIDD